MESLAPQCHQDPFASAARAPASACSPPGRSRRRSRIAEYKGPLLNLKQANKTEARGNRYLYEVNSRWTIDGTPRSNIARYANHSCNPNSESYNISVRVFVRALRNIKPGEEIVYDYGIDYLKNVIGRSNCQCSRCRKRRNQRAANCA